MFLSTLYLDQYGGDRLNYLKQKNKQKSKFFNLLTSRLDENWELMHLISAIFILAFGVGGSVLLADKKNEDENNGPQEEFKEVQKKVKQYNKDEYILYDDEDEEEQKKGDKQIGSYVGEENTPIKGKNHFFLRFYRAKQ